MNRADEADLRLIRRIAEGDRTALAALYERHARAVFAHVNLVVADRSLSEEILQDTMLAVWRGAGSFRGGSRPLSWIIAIARRQARDRLRRRSVGTAGDAMLADLPAIAPGPEQQALDRAEAAVVADAIARLNTGQREVLGLVFGTGLALADAASVLEVPLGTVKSRLAAARAALARSLTEKGYVR